MGVFFTEADIAALGGNRSWLAGLTGQAMQQGNEGLIDEARSRSRRRPGHGPSRSAADESDPAPPRLGYGETAVPYLEPTANLSAPTTARPRMKSSAISLAQPLRMS